jgi:hypothetical protein
MTLLFLLLLPFVALADQLAPTVRQAVRCWMACRVRAKRRESQPAGVPFELPKAGCKLEHQWSRWSDAVPSKSGSYMRQERTCLNCNLYEDRLT